MTPAVKRAFAIAAVAVLGAGILFGYWFPKDPCENQVLARFPSADGKLEAVTFRRDCGPKEPISTQVSVLRMGDELPNGPGNVAAVDANGGKAPAGPGGGPELRVGWWGSELRVWHHRQAHLVPAARSNPQGVTVRHDAFD